MRISRQQKYCLNFSLTELHDYQTLTVWLERVAQEYAVALGSTLNSKSVRYIKTDRQTPYKCSGRLR